MKNKDRISEVVKDLKNKGQRITVNNIITGSLATTGGTVTDETEVKQYLALYELSDLDKACRNKFRHLSNDALVKKINGAADFGWDDEGHEINRRQNASGGAWWLKMNENTLEIIKPEEVDDLFEYPGNLPEEVKTILEQFNEENDWYKECELMLSKLKPLGYSFEYGLDGEPYELRKIK